MSKSITLSFTAPIELTIQLDMYTETHRISRSQLIKTAIVAFLESQERQEEDTPKLLEKIYEEMLEIKKAVSQKQ